MNDQVRKATRHDFGDILRLYKAGLDEIGEEYKESLLVNKIVNSYHLAPCFLLVIDDKIRGMAGFTTVTTSHSGVATLCDYMFYVDPDVRSIETLGGLVKASQEFAKEQGMRMRIEFISRNDEKLRKRMFERFGFDVVAVVGGYNG